MSLDVVGTVIVDDTDYDTGNTEPYDDGVDVTEVEETMLSGGRAGTVIYFKCGQNEHYDKNKLFQDAYPVQKELTADQYKQELMQFNPGNLYFYGLVWRNLTVAEWKKLNLNNVPGDLGAFEHKKSTILFVQSSKQKAKQLAQGEYDALLKQHKSTLKQQKRSKRRKKKGQSHDDDQDVSMEDAEQEWFPNPKKFESKEHYMNSRIKCMSECIYWKIHFH